MYLQRLEIQGFKSFAQKTVFLFPAPKGEVKGITAVVGPNGSGKSNVADAIRWVLGEQSMKNLRSKKSEDVIFFGSQKKSQLGFCEVSLIFENSDRVLPLEFSEVAITRRLYRDGESEYYLNKNKVRLSDVVMLIAQANFGPKSISVIGQGMIDSIINAPASERKEYFDEAAGVKQYQIKKDQSIQKLKNTRDNLGQARLLVGELEPKIRFFNRQLKRLEEREALEKAYAEKAKTYYTFLWNELSKEVQDKKASLSRVQADIDLVAQQYRALESEFSTLDKKDSGLPMEQYQTLQKEFEAKSRDRQKLIERQSVIDGRLKNELERRGKAELSWLLARQKELIELIDSHEQTVRELEQSLGELAHTQDTLVNDVKERDAEVSRQEAVLARMAESQKSLTQEDVRVELVSIHSLKSQLTQDGLTFGALKSFVEGIYTRIEMLVKKIETALAQASRPAPIDRSALNEARAKRSATLEELSGLRVKMGVFQERIRSLKKEIENKKSEAEKLASDLAYFSSDDASHAQEELTKERGEVSAKLTVVSTEMERIKAGLAEFHQKEQTANRALLDLQRTMTSKQREVESLKEQHTRIALEMARLEAHQEELAAKISEELKVPSDQFFSSFLPFQSGVEVSDKEGLKSEIDQLKRRLEQIGTIDQEALSEYESTKERYEFLTKQIEDLSSAITSLTQGIKDLNGIIKQRFDDALENINEKFDEYFKILFSGGNARLSIQKREKPQPAEGEDDPASEVDPLDDLEQENEVCGIEIFATPPEKKLKSVSVLSGGEKAMTAIALLCAIVSNNPSPFVVLDEVDAALDDSNAVRFANIIQELMNKTQFIIITHNRVTIHTAQVLYGITMGDDGISRVLSLDIERVDAIVSQAS